MRNRPKRSRTSSSWGNFVEHLVCEEEETAWLPVIALMVVAPAGGVGQLGLLRLLDGLRLVAEANCGNATPATPTEAMAARLGRGSRTTALASSGGQ